MDSDKLKEIDEIIKKLKEELDDLKSSVPSKVIKNVISGLIAPLPKFISDIVADHDDSASTEERIKEIEKEIASLEKLRNDFL